MKRKRKALVLTFIKKKGMIWKGINKINQVSIKILILKKKLKKNKKETLENIRNVDNKCPDSNKCFKCEKYKLFYRTNIIHRYQFLNI